MNQSDSISFGNTLISFRQNLANRLIQVVQNLKHSDELSFSFSLGAAREFFGDCSPKITVAVLHKRKQATVMIPKSQHCARFAQRVFQTCNFSGNIPKLNHNLEKTRTSLHPNTPPREFLRFLLFLLYKHVYPKIPGQPRIGESAII